MSLPTCLVTCIMHNQNGQPEPGASFEFKLNRYETYEGFVVPQIMRGVADENGTLVIGLWPNQLGATGSVYDVTMRSVKGKLQRVQAVVPFEDTAFLHEISTLPAYPGKPDTQAQMEAAIEARQQAVSAMNTSLTARDVAVTASNEAQASEVAAQSAAGTAATQAGIAAAQASTATIKAEEAAASAAIFDPLLFVPRAGGVTMTGALAVPAGASGNNVPRASEVVPNTGDTTIAGVKTFSASPVVPAGASGSEAPRRSEVVGMTGDETIAGIKTFSASPVVPAGASGAQSPRAEEVAMLATTQLGFRNRVVNGNFAVNQRAVSGTVVLAAGAYGHDQWRAGAAGCTYTFAATAGVTTLTISAGSLVQPIEGASLRTGTHVLSWAGTAQGKIGAGSYAATGVTGPVTGGTNTTIEFNTGTLSQVQLEPGSRPTPFEVLDQVLDQMRCFYFHEQGSFYMVGVNSSSAGYGGHVSFKAPKRATPTVSATYANVGMSGMAISSITANGCRIGGTGAAGAVLIAAEWTASALLP